MTRLSSLLRNDAVIGCGIALAAFLVYLRTLSPTVGFMDSGELAAAQHGLGIAHPTGYPLFTMLGRAFLLLPFEGRVIWKLNLMTALVAALAVAAFYRLILFVLAGSFAAAGTASGKDRVAAGAAALALAFSVVFWADAVLLEVYSLHLLFLAVVTLLFLRSLGEPGEARPWMLFAFVLGLSFTNHMMTVLLAPAFLYLHFATFRFGKASWRRIAVAAPPFLLGLTPYLYLPIRAAARPLMNWGDPSTWDAFWRHVSGAQFRFFLFPSTESALEKLSAFLPDLARSFGYAPLLPAAVGMWAMGKSRPRLLVFSILLFAAGAAYPVSYGFEDPDFALNAYPPVALWIAFGIRFAINAVKGRARGASFRVAAMAATLSFAFPLSLNWRGADASRDHAYEDFARNVLASLDTGAIVLTRAFGALTSPTLYLQAVEGVRPDVVVIQADLLMTAWYPAHLDTRDSSVVAASRAEFAALGSAIRNGAPENLVHNLYGRVVFESIIRNNRATRAVHATADLNPGVLGGVQWGMMHRFFPESTMREGPPPFDDPEPRFRPIPRRDTRNRVIRSHYAALFANHAVRLLNAGDSTGAIERFRIAAALEPERPALAARLRELEAARSASVR